MVMQLLWLSIRELRLNLALHLRQVFSASQGGSLPRALRTFCACGSASCWPLPPDIPLVPSELRPNPDLEDTQLAAWVCGATSASLPGCFCWTGSAVVALANSTGAIASLLCRPSPPSTSYTARTSCSMPQVHQMLGCTRFPSWL